MPKFYGNVHFYFILWELGMSVMLDCLKEVAYIGLFFLLVLGLLLLRLSEVFL